MRALAVLAALLAGCSFPTVDYADATGGGTGGCTLTPACHDPATQCSQNARATYACGDKCQMSQSPACTTCNDHLVTALTACTNACASCAQGSTCPDATSTCGVVVGAP